MGLPAAELLAVDQNDVSAWQHVTLRLDLTNNLWDAYVGGELIAADLGFVEALTSGGEAINLYGNSAGTAYLDAFSIQSTNPLFTDADADGIDDAYESVNGLDSATNDRDSDLDGDGLRNIEEYVLGFDPQDPADALSDDDDQDGYSALIEVALGTNPFVMSGPVSGEIILRQWFGVGGKEINNLLNHADYPDTPDSSILLDELKFPSQIGDYHGGDIRGYIVPDVTGQYRFWVSADDRAHFFLSSDSSESNATLIASVNKYTSELQWNKYSSQQSSLISLVAGQPYYFNLLHKEGGGGDHCAAAWTKPDGTFEVIPSDVIISIPPNDIDLDQFPDDLERLIIDSDANDSLSELDDVLSEDDFDGDGLTNAEEASFGSDLLLLS